MGGIERGVDRGDRQGRAAIAELGRELREARLAHGLSQGTVGRVAGLSGSRISLIERGQYPEVPVVHLARLCGVLGLDLSVRAYPAGQPVRDAAHLELLERLHALISPTFGWRTEVPLPIPGDQRAWDAVLTGGRCTLGVEAENRLRDVQAIERRVALKKRDGGVDRVILLLRDTRWNRTVVGSHAAVLEASFPIPKRVALAALAEGRDPGGDAVLLL